MVHALVDLLHVPLAGRVLTNRRAAVAAASVAASVVAASVVAASVAAASVAAAASIHIIGIRWSLWSGLGRRVGRFRIDRIQLLEGVDRVATLFEIALLSDQIGRIGGHKTLDVLFLRDRGLEGGSEQKHDRQSALRSIHPIQKAYLRKKGVHGLLRFGQYVKLIKTAQQTSDEALTLHSRELGRGKSPTCLHC